MVRKSSLCRREGVGADSETDEEDEDGGRDPGSAHHLPQGQQGLRDRLPHLLLVFICNMVVKVVMEPSGMSMET